MSSAETWSLTSAPCVRRFLADRSYLIKPRLLARLSRGGSAIPRLRFGSGACHRHDRRCDPRQGMRRRASSASPGACISEAALKSAGADFVALWPQEIVARLLPGGFCAASPAAFTRRAPAAADRRPRPPVPARPSISRKRARSAANETSAGRMRSPPRFGATTSFSATPLGKRQASADLLRSLQRLRGCAALSP